MISQVDEKRDVGRQLYVHSMNAKGALLGPDPNNEERLEVVVFDHGMLSLPRNDLSWIKTCETCGGTGFVAEDS